MLTPTAFMPKNHLRSDRALRLYRPLAILLAAGMLCLPPAASAHPISVTEAFVYVTREKVTVNLEVFVEDLFLFHNLKPNDQDFLEPDVIEAGIEKHKKFLLDRFVIRDVEGERLQGKSVDVRRFEMEPEGVPLANLMMHKLTFVFEYPLDQPPEFLTFSQHLVDEAVLIPAEMRLRIKQESAGTPFETMLTDTPQSMRLDWQNPPLSPDASEAELDKWYSQQREQTLGITSYSSVYSFLYIEDHEVRHEILIPLLTLEASVLIARQNDAFLEIAEQDAARRQIEAFFLAGNPVEIDGKVIEPEVQRLDFYGLDFKDFARRAERRRVSMASARVGIILSYPVETPPNTVKVTWDRFNKFIWTVNMIVYAYNDGFKTTLSRIGDENVFEWNSPEREPPPPLEALPVELPPPPKMSLPLLSLVGVALLPIVGVVLRRRGAAGTVTWGALLSIVIFCAATWPIARWEMPHPFFPTPTLSDQQANVVFAQLHRNTYRAFEFRDEEEIYDALAKSVDGDLLRELYLQIQQGLKMQEQGGATSRIREVSIVSGQAETIDDSDPYDRRGFRYQCRWTVNGTVEHWGHIHARTNQYDALFRVEPRDGQWKITDLDVLSEERLAFETSLRGT